MKIHEMKIHVLVPGNLLHEVVRDILGSNARASKKPEFAAAGFVF
jgi:hypothetical protein